MNLTPKERSLLTDLKADEELCIEKYSRYEKEAHDENLAAIFKTIKEAERSHLTTVCEILAGNEVSTSSESPSATAAMPECSMSPCSPDEKAEDAFLAKDALSMEKHVAGSYNTSIFEFSSPVLRDTLAHIEKEEQNHGEMLWCYLDANGMYS